MTRIRQFHIAILVHDLAEARRFYGEVLGAREGRAAPGAANFDLYGHHLVLRDGAGRRNPFAAVVFPRPGELTHVPSFGLNLDWVAWGDLALRIRSRQYPFVEPPHVRMLGLPDEHATLFVVDPAGNVLEFKAFRHHEAVFARMFGPQALDAPTDAPTAPHPRD